MPFTWLKPTVTTPPSSAWRGSLTGTATRWHGKAPIIACLAVITMNGLLPDLAFADETDTVRIIASLRHSWDDNYNRSPDSGQEQITVASAGLALKQNISRQQLSANVGVSRYEHSRRDFLDATTYRAGAAWAGQLGRILRTRVSWNRYEQPVSRDQFIGKDILTFDNRQASLTFVPGNNWRFPAGVRHSSLEHSNPGQQAINYQDREAFVGIGYVSGRNSSVTLELARGDRDYPRQNLNRPDDIPPGADLNFDYTNAALSSTWVVTAKTKLEGRVDYFQRDGEVNDDNGSQVSLETHWKATHKLGFRSGYQYVQPAVGETTDSPTEVHRIFVEADWQATPKLELSTRVAHARAEYDEQLTLPARTEKVYRWAPLIASYQFTDQLALTLSSALLKQESPRADRDYIARELSAGMRLQF